MECPLATLISTVTHVALFYGPDVWRRARNSKSEEPDIHLKLMRRYREAPEWWFMAVFVVSFAFGLIASQVWQTHLPWWAYILCVLIGVVLFISHWHHSGHYEPANGAQRHHRDDHLDTCSYSPDSPNALATLLTENLANRPTQAPRPPHCHDAFQVMGLYARGQRPHLHLRHEGRPLHEGPASQHVRRPGRLPSSGYPLCRRPRTTSSSATSRASAPKNSRKA